MTKKTTTPPAEELVDVAPEPLVPVKIETVGDMIRFLNTLPKRYRIRDNEGEKFNQFDVRAAEAVVYLGI